MHLVGASTSSPRTLCLLGAVSTTAQFLTDTRARLHFRNTPRVLDGHSGSRFVLPLNQAVGSSPLLLLHACVDEMAAAHRADEGMWLLFRDAGAVVVVVVPEGVGQHALTACTHSLSQLRKWSQIIAYTAATSPRVSSTQLAAISYHLPSCLSTWMAMTHLELLSVLFFTRVAITFLYFRMGS